MEINNIHLYKTVPPILFIIFKRPEIAKKSFSKIKAAKPIKLYIACDGPHVDNLKEKELVDYTRKTIQDMIDWECDVHYLFQEKNLGCSQGVYTAISWFFDNVDAGIILEDDCVITPSFFRFAFELLDKYKNDDRIGMIAGTNQCNIQTDNSYYFSRYKACWGWATWKRAWDNMDLSMTWREMEYYESVLRNMGYRGADIHYWKYRITLIDRNRVNAWDWQWYFTLAAQNQLSIFPKVNLVSNIGFGEGATHTSNKKQLKQYLPNKELDFPLIHPKYIVPNDAFDKDFYRNNNTLYYTLMRYVPFAVKNIVKKIIR